MGMSDAAPILPLARVKKIAKCDEEVKSISANGNVLMAKAAELFISQLAESAYEHTSSNKRKVVKVDDVVEAIQGDDNLGFLEEHLDTIAPNRGAEGGRKKKK